MISAFGFRGSGVLDGVHYSTIICTGDFSSERLLYYRVVQLGSGMGVKYNPRRQKSRAHDCGSDGVFPFFFLPRPLCRRCFYR